MPFAPYTLVNIQRIGSGAGFQPAAALSLGLGGPALDPRITFSRGSEGTLYNSAGQLQYAPHNILPWSTNLQDASWVPAGMSAVLSSISGPFATNMTLVTVASVGATGLQKNINFSALTNGGIVYIACTWHVKRGNQPWVGLRMQCGGGTSVNLQQFYNFDTDTIGGQPAPNVSLQRVLLANGIVRLTGIIQTVAGNITFQPFIRPSPNGPPQVGDSVYVSDPMVEVLLDPTTPLNPYQPTGASAVYGPRFDYDPVTLQPRGLLIEEARSNSIRNSTMQGAVIGGALPTNWSVITANGLTTTVIATGVESGVPYMDVQVSGTATGTSYNLAFEVNNSIAATNGQAWAHSAFLKLAGGSFAGVTQFQLVTSTYSSVPALLTSYSTNLPWPAAGTLAQQRVSGIITIADATVAFVAPSIGFTCVSGAAINFTLRIGLPQAEQAAFATSPIPTYNATYTRLIDLPTLTTSPWYNLAAGTLVAEGTLEAIHPTQNAFFVQADDGTVNNRIAIFVPAGGAAIDGYTQGGGLNFTNTGPVPQAGIPYKCALGRDTTTTHFAVNGVQYAAVTGTTQAAITTLRLGYNHNNASALCGWLRSVTYWNTRLSDAQLLTLTQGAPALSFDFTRGTLDPSITFTRSTTATYFDNTGTLQTAAINAARFDYDPVALTPNGLLIEEARTNGVRNNTGAGAVAGTPGTPPTNWAWGNLSSLSTQVVGTGAENGIAYIDVRIFGTSAGNTASLFLEGTNAIAATPGQTWTYSAYFKFVNATPAAGIGGSGLNLFVRELNAGSTFLQDDAQASFLPSSAPLARGGRQTFAFTAANASVAFLRPAFSISFPTGVAVDITLRIGLPQLELGAFATSVIPTSSVAVTRNADVATVALGTWFNASQGTIEPEYILGSLATTVGNEFVAVIDDGSASNRFWIGSLAASTTNAAIVVTGSSSQLGGFTRTLGTAKRAGLAYQASNTVFAVSGALSSGSPSNSALPAGLTTLRLGAGSAGNYLNGWLRKFAYYSSRLSNAQLIQITT